MPLMGDILRCFDTKTDYSKYFNPGANSGVYRNLGQPTFSRSKYPASIPTVTPSADPPRSVIFIGVDAGADKSLA